MAWHLSGNWWDIAANKVGEGNMAVIFHQLTRAFYERWTATGMSTSNWLYVGVPNPTAAQWAGFPVAHYGALYDEMVTRLGGLLTASGLTWINTGTGSAFANIGAVYTASGINAGTVVTTWPLRINWGAIRLNLEELTRARRSVAATSLTQFEKAGSSAIGWEDAWDAARAASESSTGGGAECGWQNSLAGSPYASIIRRGRFNINLSSYAGVSNGSTLTYVKDHGGASPALEVTDSANTFTVSADGDETVNADSLLTLGASNQITIEPTNTPEDSPYGESTGSDAVVPKTPAAVVTWDLDTVLTYG